jgi:hypothetical protein
MNSTSNSLRLEHLKINIGELTFSKLYMLLFAGSFLVHVIVVAIFIHQPIALDDMFQYDMLARSLKDGNGFRWYSQADVEILRSYYAQFLDLDRLVFPVNGLETTLRAPGYPFFLALVYAGVPDSLRFILARLAQAGLAAALAPLAAMLCRQVGFSRKAGVLAAIGISLYPILLLYPVGLASENLYIVLGVAAFLAILHSAKKPVAFWWTTPTPQRASQHDLVGAGFKPALAPALKSATGAGFKPAPTGDRPYEKSWGWIVLAGLLCGLAMFTRSIFAVFTLLAGVWLWRFSPLKLKAGLIFLLTAFEVCLPWSMRNSILMQKPAFVENSAGYNLFIGYHPEGDGGFISRIAIMPMNILDDAQRERYCWQQALAFIQQDPLGSAGRVFARLVKFMGPEDREFFYFYSNNSVGAIPQPWLAMLYALLVFPWASTLYFGMIGLWVTRDRKVVWLAGFFLFGYGLPHLFIIAEPRFHLAWLPVLLPFAAYGWIARRKIVWKPILKGKKWLLAALLLGITLVFALGFGENFSRLVSVMSPGGNTLYFSY